MDGIQTLEIKASLDAPRKQVYKAFTSSVALESWFSDFAEIVPAENGRFYVHWNAGHYACGLVKELEENKRLVFTWRGQGESKETEVEVVFDELDDLTQISIYHRNLGTSGHWEESAKAIQSGWESALRNLNSVLETGLDPRIYDRPLLGVYPNRLINAEDADKLGLPVATGVQIGGVVENLGAEAAGLKAEDVLFSLNGHELLAFTDFAAAIDGVKAGDTVDVVYYRDGVKHTVAMTLSRRPLPDIPESPKEFANIVAESYQEIDADLNRVFAGVSEEEASRRPEPEEWSAKETLVHLLYSERWLHLAISCALTDQRTGGFANQLSLIKAMADSYTLENLIKELQFCEQITVRSLAALPEDFVADKRKYLAFASTNGQGFALHTRSHLPQIEAAIAAARN